MSYTVRPPRPLSLSVVALLLLLLSVAALAQQEQSATSQQDFSHIRIKNFGQMDERFYRGAEPKRFEDFENLKALGIDTVIDLQAEFEPEEREWVESLGMRYVSIPMIAKKYPRPEHVAEFLRVVDDPATGKFFVHCAGGRHRTGAMGAVYRYEKYGWDFERVYREMKKFDFYTRWGHGSFKDFVRDYEREMHAAEASRDDATETGAQ